MATTLSRTGTIFKKCDLSNHKPETNKACVAGTCQHTCGQPEKCPHAWTLRYTLNGNSEDEASQRHGKAAGAHDHRGHV
jgi:hypothetical protein